MQTNIFVIDSCEVTNLSFPKFSRSDLAESRQVGFNAWPRERQHSGT